MKELLNGKLMEETLGKLMGLHPELEEGLAQIHMALHDPYGYVCQLEAAWRLEETEDGCPDITDGHILKFAEMLYSQEFISGETSYELPSQFQDHLIHEDRKAGSCTGCRNSLGISSPYPSMGRIKSWAIPIMS